MLRLRGLAVLLATPRRGEATTTTAKATTTKTTRTAGSDVGGCAVAARCFTRAEVNAANNYGGWGSAAALPTCDDVRAILRYVPVNWGNMGLLNIPAEVRRRHVRLHSVLLWMRRQPAYFELRDMDGTVEVRRSVALHPDAHGLTAAQARAQVERQMRDGTANSLVTLLPRRNGGAVKAAAEATYTRATRQVLRFLRRACPTYFATAALLLPRCGNRNVTGEVLLELARRHSDEFEVLRLRYSDVALLRRRAGVDSARWRDAFCADVERHPGDVRAVVALMRHTCALWDRPEYLYARLSDDERALVGGYAAMLALLARHPRVWRVGAHFVCRVDAADPTAPSSLPREPAPEEMTSRAICCPLNPYTSQAVLVRVFHYAAPEGEVCSADFFVGCASPAMRVVLPPRVTDVLQVFPDLFACRETTPGVFVARKLRVVGNAAATDEARDGGDNAPVGSGGVDNSWQDEEQQLCDDAHVRREDVVDALAALVPDGGVEASHLLLWASLALQRAAARHGGGVVKLAEQTPSHFRVVDNGYVKMIYRAQAPTPA